MNPNNRTNIRNNSFPRLGSSLQNRPGHHSRWHINHLPFSKDFQQGYSQGSSGVSNDRDKDMFGFPKPPGVPSQAFTLDGATADVRSLPPPLLPHQRPLVHENPVPLLNRPLMNLNLNPGLLAPIENTEYQQREFHPRAPSTMQPDMRHNPVTPTSGPFHHAMPPNGQEDGRKEMCSQSESPSRKRRRIVQNAQGQSNVPLPAHHQSPWEPRRNPRTPPRNTIPVRRPNRYSREWSEENHTLPRIQHPPAFPPPHPSTSHHQPPVMMDIAQVPISLPLPLYPNGPTPVAHVPPCQIHSIYGAAPPPHSCQLNSFGGCMSHHTGGHHHHHHHAAGSVLFPPLAHVHYSAHLAPRHDPIEIDIIMDPHHRAPPAPSHPHQAILHLTSPSGIIFSEMPRRASGRRWSRPFQPPPSPFPGWLHILAMFSNPPLSPYSQDPSELHHQPENYEEFLNIADRLGEAKPRGLTKAEIDQLPSFKYTSEGSEGDKMSCVICLCDFEARQTLRGLPCSHQFHAKCIDKWLKSNPTCPICRGDASAYVVRSD